MGFPTAFYLLPLFPMSVPKTVRYWLTLRAEYERRLETEPDPMPRVLPIAKIGRRWYFVDERLREYRNVLDPSDTLPLYIEEYLERTLEEHRSQK